MTTAVLTRECEDVTGEWGQECPSCGNVLPKPYSEKAYFARRDAEREARIHVWRTVSEEERHGSKGSATKRRNKAIAAGLIEPDAPKPPRVIAAECGEFRPSGPCARTEGHRGIHMTAGALLRKSRRDAAGRAARAA